MANQQYISKYSNGKNVSAAQFITEIICEHKAKIQGGDLHYRFWLSAKWEKFYKGQIGQANKLLKSYAAAAIIEALKSTQGRKIYSLRAQHLLPIIDKYQKIHNSKKDLDVINQKSYDDCRSKINTQFRQQNQRNVIDILEEIDNEP